jgi:hypothetical protein
MQLLAPLATLFLLQATVVAGFVVPKTQVVPQQFTSSSKPLKWSAICASAIRTRGSSSSLLQVASSASGETPTSSAARDNPSPPTEKEKGKSLKELRAEGGLLTFNTPVGALNPYAIYYGLTSIILGIPWFFALKGCQFLYWITRGKFDPKVRTCQDIEQVSC